MISITTLGMGTLSLATRATIISSWPRDVGKAKARTEACRW